MFIENLPESEHETVVDAGHSPFVEKPALVYEKLRTFLIQDDAIERLA